MIISVENAKFVDHLVIIVLTYSCLEMFMPRENEWMKISHLIVFPNLELLLKL